MKVEAGDTYKHFKGTIYNVIDIAIHSETQERLVLYCAADEKGFSQDPIWARPEEMFLEEVTRDGKTFPRFEKLEEKKGYIEE